MSDGAGRVDLWLDLNWTHRDFAEAGPGADLLLRRLCGMRGYDAALIPSRPGLRQPKRGPWLVVTALPREQAEAFMGLFVL